MGEKEKKITYYNNYYCFIGGKAHDAYVHSNIGAALIWCPKHGLLASQTLERTNRRKKMTYKQYDEFVEKKVNRHD